MFWPLSVGIFASVYGIDGSKVDDCPAPFVFGLKVSVSARGSTRGVFGSTSIELGLLTGVVGFSEDESESRGFLINGIDFSENESRSRGYLESGIGFSDNCESGSGGSLEPGIGFSEPSRDGISKPRLSELSESERRAAIANERLPIRNSEKCMTG